MNRIDLGGLHAASIFLRWESSPLGEWQDSGELKVCHAGEPRHAGFVVSEYGIRLCWIPVCTGMTAIGVDFESTNSEPLGLEPKVVQLNPYRRQRQGVNNRYFVLR